MTLQQKMLAKQSKKGFTLVELVVVIAILAILAAIAIPAVIGIINSASQSSGDSDASTLNSGVKTVYSGVTTGKIVNGKTTDAAGNTISWGAEADGSKKEWKEAADAVTMKQVQEYNGTNINLKNMYYITANDDTKHFTKGTIVYWDGDDNNKPSDNTSEDCLTNDTEIGTFYVG